MESNFAWKSKSPLIYEQEVDEYDAFIIKKEEIITNGEKDVNESGYLSPAEVKRRTEIIDKEIASGFTYFNIYPGDGFRFKPRGFFMVNR